MIAKDLKVGETVMIYNQTLSGKTIEEGLATIASSQYQPMRELECDSTDSPAVCKAILLRHIESVRILHDNARGKE